jgi:hypothetical protein
MEESAMKLRTLLLPLLFVISLTATGYIVAKVHRVQARQGFTLQITQTAYPLNRDPILSATIVRYQKSDGSWRAETTYTNGRVAVGFAQPGRGVYNVNEKSQRLDYISGSSGLSITEDSLRRDPGFVGEETILGFKTLHIHAESELKAGDYTDFYMCPALQGYPLRAVSGSKSGSKTVFEVTRVILGEPSFTVPNYPVDMTHFEQVHAASPNAPQ